MTVTRRGHGIVLMVETPTTDGRIIERVDTNFEWPMPLMIAPKNGFVNEIAGMMTHGSLIGNELHVLCDIEDDYVKRMGDEQWWLQADVELLGSARPLYVDGLITTMHFPWGKLRSAVLGKQPAWPQVAFHWEP